MSDPLRIGVHNDLVVVGHPRLDPEVMEFTAEQAERAGVAFAVAARRINRDGRDTDPGRLVRLGREMGSALAISLMHQCDTEAQRRMVLMEAMLKVADHLKLSLQTDTMREMMLGDQKGEGHVPSDVPL